jgi:ribosomal protein S18 acetylase RimI-like enzyme
VGFVWPPGVRFEEPDRSAIEDAILAAISHRLDELDLCFGQVVIDPEDLALGEMLERNGFPHLTDLHYLLCPVNSARVARPPATIEMEIFDEPTNAGRFVRVLEQTYQGTFDCPELDGLRTPEEALAGHRATGKFDPGRWRLIRWNGRDAGLLLISDHPDRELWEIVYLGVVPEARGQGLGEAVVQWAIADARAASRPIALAVDTRNFAARRIYERAGFVELARQSVHLRPASGRPFLQSTDYAHRPEGGRRNS